MDARQKPLQAFEVSFPFVGEELAAMSSTGRMPSFCNVRRAIRRIADQSQMKARLPNKLLVHAWRQEQIEADRTPNGEFFGGYQSCHDHCIREQHPASRPKETIPIRKDRATVCDVAHRIV